MQFLENASAAEAPAVTEKLDTTPQGVRRHREEKSCTSPLPPNPDARTPAPKKSKRNPGPPQKVILSPLVKKSRRKMARLSMNSPSVSTVKKRPTAVAKEKTQSAARRPKPMCVNKWHKIFAEVNYIRPLTPHDPSTIQCVI